MTAFRWRLDPVLQLRSFEREQARVALAAAWSAAQAAALREQQARAACEAAGWRFCAELRAGVPAVALRATQAGVAALRSAQRQHAQAVLDAEAKLAAARAAVLAARRHERSLEILRDKALAAHRAEVARREQAALDELASQRFARREAVV